MWRDVVSCMLSTITDEHTFLRAFPFNVKVYRVQTILFIGPSSAEPLYNHADTLFHQTEPKDEIH